MTCMLPPMRRLWAECGHTMPAALDHHASDMFGHSGGTYPAGQLLQPRPGDSNVRGIPIDVVEFDGEIVRMFYIPSQLRIHDVLCSRDAEMYRHR